MKDTPYVLLMENVGHEYGEGPTRNRALTGVDLHLRPGELVAIMGVSGAGKSTLLNIAGGLQRPTRGSVIIDGHDTSVMDAGELAALRRRTIGYVFQEFNLIPSLSVIENVELPLLLDGVSRKDSREAAYEALDRVRGIDLADAFPERLSGGQQQRISIARALVGHRSILLADEPTGALDSNTSEEIMKILRNHIDSGAAGILATHEARFAAWADRTVFLRDGIFIDRLREETLPDWNTSL